MRFWLYFTRKLISEHERIETLVVNGHEELKSRVRMIEDECSTARSDFSSLENELDGLNQRYVKLRESALNLNSVSMHLQILPYCMFRHYSCLRTACFLFCCM